MCGVALNKPVLQQIDEEMGRSVRSSDNHLDYIPTQYLCDFIHNYLPVLM